jgi:hypothetical protein
MMQQGRKKSTFPKNLNEFYEGGYKSGASHGKVLPLMFF